MALSVQRLTLFALISVFESDARLLIANALLPDATPSNLFGDQVIERARDRMARSTDLIVSEQADVALLDFLDLGDYVQCINKNRNKLSKTLQGFIGTRGKILECIIQIRNRVMHNRPLDFDDLPVMKSFCDELSKTDTLQWTATRELLKEMRRDPTYVFRFEEEFRPENVDTILHNLPSPDFDDTGFVGRSEHIQRLAKAIKGNFPVITILGEGGLGKTSLALKVLYDLIDSIDKQFDAIIWTTAKANVLTPSDIVSIEGAIKDSLGIFKAAAVAIGGSTGENPLETLNRWLSEFNILLVIDNLETILDERIREFAADIPNGSKIIFTTRVGLGAYDFPIELRQLSEKEGTDYFRRVCDVFGLGELKGRDSNYVKEACSRLQWNPLAIKWFAQAVKAGGKPSSILADPKLVLKFCVENVINNLSSDARGVLDALVITAKPQSLSSLHFILDLDTVDLSASLRELRAANLVSVTPSISMVGDDLYQVTSISNLYIRNYFTPSISTQASVRRKQEQLSRAREGAFKINEGINNYNQNYVYIRSEYAESDTVVAEYLKAALSYMRNDNLSEAEEAIQRSKDMSPNYFEVYRVEALLAWQKQNALRAESAYERAVSLKPDYAPLRRWCGGFFLRINEMVKARNELTEAVRLDPDRSILQMELARTNLRLKEFLTAKSQLLKLDAGQLNRREKKQLLEIWLQLFTSELETINLSGDLQGASAFLEQLEGHISLMDVDLLDDKHSITIGRLVRALERFVIEERGGERGVKATFAAQALQGFLQSPQEIDRQSQAYAEDQSFQGAIKSILVDKGFGFIRDESGKDWFFHKKHMHISRDFLSLYEGARVRFRIGENDKGLCAVDVEPS